MQDYHAEKPVNGAASISGPSALKSAIGMVALLAWLVLNLGGVEIARADPAQTEGTLIVLDGKAIGTAVATDEKRCGAATAAGSARVVADIQQLVQQQAARKGAEGDSRPPMALNSRGYNYGSPVALNRHGR